jgi:ferredoxin
MARIMVDRGRCEGHGLCEQTAPDVFRLDDDGRLDLAHEQIDAAQEALVSAAIRVCPVAALRIEP